MAIKGVKKGVYRICECCKHVFYVPQYRASARFCSNHCFKYGQFKDKRPVSICIECGKEFSDSPSRGRINRRFCSMECKLAQQKTERERRKMSREKLRANKSRNCNLSRFLRRWIWEHKDKKCEVCGYEGEQFCYDLHHKDEDCNNNQVDNIMVLCAICHRRLHYFLKNDPKQAAAISYDKAGKSKKKKD